MPRPSSAAAPTSQHAILPPSRRASRRVPLLCLAVLAAGCDAGTEPRLEEGNVVALLNASVVHTETAVEVNGVPTLRFPSSDSALWLDRFDQYELGGFPELDYPQDEAHSVGWVLMLTHRRDRIARNDSVIYSYHDHGAAFLADHPMDKLTELPGVTPGVPVGFDDFVRYYLTLSHVVEWTSGEVIDYGTLDIHPALTAGDDLLFRTTGSDQVAPLERSFSAAPFAVLEGLENGDPVDLAGGVPVITTTQPLALSFTRPLGPGRGAVVLVPFEGGDPAFVQATEESDRWVIPTDVLDQLVPGPETAPVAFRLIVIEYLIQDDAVLGSLADGGTFSLPFVQSGETSVSLYIQRGD